MRDKESDEQDRALAQEMLDRFQAGESKSTLEIEYWNDGTSHGKRFTSFVRKHLGVETESRSRQTQELERLRNLLRRSGISPSQAGDLTVENRLVAKAREAALAAIRHYNDPTAGLRTDGFIVWMVIAWNALLQALLERDGLDYYDRDENGKIIEIGGRAKVKGTWDLLTLALGGDEHRALRFNLDFFLNLRHLIEHRYIPALDIALASEAQAMLLNFGNYPHKRFWRRSCHRKSFGYSSPAFDAPPGGTDSVFQAAAEPNSRRRLGVPKSPSSGGTHGGSS